MKVVFIQDKFKEMVALLRSGVKSISAFVGIGPDHSGDYDYESFIAAFPATEPDVEVKKIGTVKY